MEEVEERVSATEDNHGAHSTCIAAVEKTVKQLQLKKTTYKTVAKVKT